MGPTPYPSEVLDREGVRSAGEELARLLSVKRLPTLLLDLSRAVMPTAAGLGELVALHQSLAELGADLVLCNLNDRTFEAMAVSGLIDVLDVRRPGAA